MDIPSTMVWVCLVLILSAVQASEEHGSLVSNVHKEERRVTSTSEITDVGLRFREAVRSTRFAQLLDPDGESDDDDYSGDAFPTDPSEPGEDNSAILDRIVRKTLRNYRLRKEKAARARSQHVDLYAFWKRNPDHRHKPHITNTTIDHSLLLPSWMLESTDYAPRFRSLSTAGPKKAPWGTYKPKYKALPVTDKKYMNYAPSSCRVCVLVLERLKLGLNVMPSIPCSEVLLRFPDAYAKCQEVVQSLEANSDNVRFMVWEGCYKYESYDSEKEWIHPCPSHVVCSAMHDRWDRPFCNEMPLEDPFATPQPTEAPADAKQSKTSKLNVP